MKRPLAISAVAVALTLSVIAAASGCSSATGEVTGGAARFDASPPQSSLSSTDAGPLSAGSSWEALYTDYFGNPGRASCAGNGSCHGDANQAGAKSSAFVCDAADRNACYASLVSTAASLVVAKNAASSPLLTQVLRHADGSSGNMPKSPPYGFTATDLQRISDWINAGAPNDTAASSGDDAGADAEADLDASASD